MNRPLDQSDPAIPLIGNARNDQGVISGTLKIGENERTVVLKGNYSSFVSDINQETLNDFFLRSCKILLEAEAIKYELAPSITQVHPPLASNEVAKPDQTFVKRSHTVGATRKSQRGNRWITLSKPRGGVRLYEQEAHTFDTKKAAHEIITQTVQKGSLDSHAKKYGQSLLGRWEDIQNPRTSFGKNGFMVNCKAFRNLLDHIVGQKRAPGYKDSDLVDHFYMPALVNSWRHTTSRVPRFRLLGNSPEVSLVRCGAIYDNRCGLFSSNDLKELLDSPTKREAKVKEIEEKIDDLKEKSDKKSQKKIFAYEVAKDLISSPESINKALGERKIILETQFLTLVWEHLKAQKGQFKGGEFSIAQLGLLNPSVSKISGSWTHFEDKEIEEMHTLFEKMDGANLQFDDSEAPWIDKDDVIHLPKNLCTDASSRPTTLRSHFINVDVQMSSTPTRFSFLNRFYKKSIKKGKLLSSMITPGLIDKMKDDSNGQELLKRLSKGESGYTLAGEVLSFLKEQGYQLGVNCQSGKDRTGIVCEAFMQKEILKDTQPLVEAFVSEIKRIRESIRKLEGERSLQQKEIDDAPDGRDMAQAQAEIHSKREEIEDFESEEIKLLRLFDDILVKSEMNPGELERYLTKELSKGMTALPLDVETIALQIIAHNDSSQTEIKVDPRRIFTIDASRKANSKSLMSFLYKSIRSLLQGKKSEV